MSIGTGPRSPVKSPALEPRAEMDFDILKIMSDQEKPGRR